jgi:hypothetical protein
VIFYYRFGSLRLASEIVLAQVRPAENRGSSPEIFLSVGAGEFPRPDRVLFTWPGYYRLSLGLCGADWLLSSARGIAFLISRNGGNLRGFCREPGLRGEFEDLFVRRVMPRIAALAGLTAIHAAAVGTGQGALLLSGPSGAGKSTLSAALAYHFGWAMLSDDISILRGDGEATVSPAAIGVGLRSDSYHALQPPSERCGPMHSGGGKVWFYPNHGDDPSALPVRAAVSLSRTGAGAAPQLEPLSPAEGLIMAARQLVLFHPGDRSERQQQMQRLAAVSRGIPAYRFTYPACYEALPEVAAKLTHLLSS